MANQFQCWQDDFGDIWCAAGSIVDLATGTTWTVSGDLTAEAPVSAGAGTGHDGSPRPFRQDNGAATCLGGSSGRCGAAVMVSAGAAVGGYYADAADTTWEVTFPVVHSWVCVALSTWHIFTATDGSAVIYDGTDYVAAREALGQRTVDPGGVYVSTDYGAAAYNAAVAFEIAVRRVPAEPAAGVVYATVTETTGGAIASVAGPTLAGSLPAPSGLSTSVALAIIDGAGPRQIIDGPIYWRANFAATAHVHQSLETARTMLLLRL